VWVQTDCEGSSNFVNMKGRRPVGDRAFEDLGYFNQDDLPAPSESDKQGGGFFVHRYQGEAEARPGSPYRSDSKRRIGKCARVATCNQKMKRTQMQHLPSAKRM
jgi:hypothetical protein